MKIYDVSQSNNKNDLPTKALLDTYLKGAVAISSGKTQSDAANAIKKYQKEADKKQLFAAPNLMNKIEDQEKSLEEKASSFGVKTMLNYALNADVGDLSNVISLGMSGVATSLLLPIVAQDVNALSVTLLAASAASVVVRGGKVVASEFVASKTPEEKKKVLDYTDIMHTRLALKMLKREIKETSQEKKAENTLVSAAMLKQQRAGR